MQKNLGHIKDATIIQDAAIDLAKYILFTRLEEDNSAYNKPLWLIYTTKYLALFDLNDILKNEIHDIINTLIKTPQSKPTEWFDFLRLINVTKSLGLLTPDIMKSARHTMIKFSQQLIDCDYAETLSSKKTGFGLPEFLDMARTVQLPKAKQTEIYLAYLSKHNFDYYNNKELRNLADNLEPIVLDDEAFKKTLEAVATGDDFEARINQFLRHLSTYSTDLVKLSLNHVKDVIQKKKHGVQLAAAHALAEQPITLPSDTIKHILGFFGAPSKLNKQVMEEVKKHTEEKAIEKTPMISRFLSTWVYGRRVL